MGRELIALMTAEQALEFARLVRTAEAGDGDAACRLGDMYREGTGGLRYSPKQAFRWYARSAMCADASGQNNLGACYEHGIGCRQSYVNAVKWYRLSVAQRLGTASMNLGYCYLRGHGVTADRAEALRLLRIASEQGEHRAAEELERLSESVTHSSVRLVDETQPGTHFRLEFPEITEAARRAVLKDDCFGLPERGTPAYEDFERESLRVREALRRRGTFPARLDRDDPKLDRD